MKKFAFSLIIGFLFTFLLGCTYSGPIEIVYHLNNTEDDVTVHYDDRENLNFYSDFSKEGYSFLGWYLDSDLSDEVTEEDLTKIKDSSIELYASWEKESFSISYYLPSGTLLFTEEYDYLDKVTAFTDLPEIEGYRFTGWNRIVPAKMPSNNVVLTAVYEINEYQLIYHNPFLDYVVTKNVKYDAQLTLLVPTEPGYTFEGWYTDEALTSRFTGTFMPSSNVELYAKWSKTTFHIFFNSIDSTIYPPVDTTIDSVVTSLPSVSLPGLVFEGWFYEGEKLSAPFNFTYAKDISLTSRWSDSSGLIYEMFYSHAEICGYDGNASVVVFPNEVALHTVTLVQESAFEGNNTLEEIIGNEDLTTLETKSFANMPNLKSATFSFNTVNLGQNVFFNDTLMEELTISLNINMILPRFFGVTYVDIPDSFSRIIVSEGTTEVNESLVSSFFPHEITLYLPASWTEVTNDLLGKATMTSLWVPRTITTIKTEAFAGGTLSEIVFEDDSTLTTIEYRAFWDANFVSITIPSSVTTIEPGAFMGCSDLVSINVAAENPNYIDEGGVLYNKDKTVLVKYPSASLSDTFTIPATVQIIEAYALSTSYHLRSIYFEEGSNLTEIKEYSFSSLRDIESIILPDSLLTIGDEAFRGITNVNYVFIPDSVVTIGDHILNLTLAVNAVFIES
ncbi:MAG: leucine-rich repeat protein, partial [Candidatus Izemoplasmatales bacterium]